MIEDSSLFPHGGDGMEKPIERVVPGETLSADVTDGTGRIMYPRGATLTESAIAALGQRGVSTVSVVGESAPLNPALLAKATERARKYYAGHDMTIPPGPDLLGLRVEAEAQRMEKGLPALLRECRQPVAETPGHNELPAFCLDSFEPPQLSAVAFQLNRELFAPEPSNQRVIAIIGQSPGLTARLLRLVNSPLYGFHGRVETVSRAVTIVGLREVGMLASSLLMVEQFGVIPSSVVDMRTFLAHCLACALAAKALAQATGAVEPEQAFVAGLLHDIGRLYFFTAFPERSRYCINSSLRHGRPLMDEEVLFFGTDHGTMGRHLLEGWAVPRSLSQAAGFHHDPLKAPEPMLPGVLHLADLIVHAMGLGCSGECGPPSMRPGFSALLPLRPEQTADIAARIGDELSAIVAAFH
jgi:putative nucleotidyltransferase with HDIG domain